MDIGKWESASWSEDAWRHFEAEALDDLRQQLQVHGLQLYKQLPNKYFLGVVAATADERKFLHISTPDVREGGGWSSKVALRRMSSERDWKGNNFHYCDWQNVGENALKYFGDEYDDEADEV